MTLASLVLVIIRDIRGQILQPRISRIPRIMGAEHFQSSFQPLDRIQLQWSDPHYHCDTGFAPRVPSCVAELARPIFGSTENRKLALFLLQS